LSRISRSNAIRRQRGPCVALLAVAWLAAGSFAAEPSRTVAEAVADIDPHAEARLRNRFEFNRIAYPPERVTLIAIKQQRTLELWASSDGRTARIGGYSLKALSGWPGPKLRAGDRQVPEGLYRVTALNPNSAYHLSLKLNYPNHFDRVQARRDGRGDPGSNIFIHGEAASRGCLAVGNRAIEELFVLAARLGGETMRVIIAPRDPRTDSLFPIPHDAPPWTADLYRVIEREVGRYRLGGALARTHTVMAGAD